MQTQYKVIGYSIDLSFDDYKLPIEINENEHRNRNNDKIIKQKAMENVMKSRVIVKTATAKRI